MTTTVGRGIDHVLADARPRLDRLTPREAFDAVLTGAVLVDIRPKANREAEGEIPGARVIERNVLEWRLDPRSEDRVTIAGYDVRVIVFCNEGYTSSLAAAALHELGIHRATDLIGGYRAWRAAGLPTESGDLRVGEPAAHVLDQDDPVALHLAGSQLAGLDRAHDVAPVAPGHADDLVDGEWRSVG
jgi:rhodanese-related sulfurtransferase